MRLNSLLIAAAFVWVAGASQAATPACKTSAAQVEQIKATVDALFDALGKDDDKALDHLLAPSFYAFEGGVRFTGGDLRALIKGQHAKGVVYRWAPQGIDARVCQDVAWAAWENHGAVGPAGDMKPVTWLESAGLHREPGGWVIDFLQATRAPAAK
jgi:hypothetical protein